MPDVAEPSTWLFDGRDPHRDLPPAEAEQVAAMTIEYGDPVYATLPETTVDAVSELLRGFYAHTPYRRLAGVERVDEQAVRVRAEQRASSRDETEWVPEIHPEHVAAIQSRLIEYFGPLWRARAGEAAGSVLVRRVIGREFGYPNHD